jgi:hypothetical protein
MDIEAKMRFLLYILAPIGNLLFALLEIFLKILIALNFTVQYYEFSEFELVGCVSDPDSLSPDPDPAL